MTKEEIKSIYDEAYKDVFGVYEHFKYYYGEERVDLQEIYNFSSIYSSLENKKVDQIFSRNVLSTSTYEENKDKIFLEEELTPEYRKALIEVIRNLKSNAVILVHWNSVIVENELNEKTEIQDLYAKISIDMDGVLLSKFKLCRMTYTQEHYLAGYSHSHVPSVYENNIGDWQDPCTGSGPINGTMSLLYRDNNDDIWPLFCLELDKYVHTESLSGGPYFRIASIKQNIAGEILYYSTRGPVYWYNQETRDFINAFNKYFIKKVYKDFKIKYVYGCYSLAIPLYDFHILYSKELLEYVGKYMTLHPSSNVYRRLVNDGVLIECTCNGNKFFRTGRRNRNHIENFPTAEYITFKGENRHAKLIQSPQNDDEEEIRTMFLAKYEYANYLYFRINYILNLKYDGKDNTNNYIKAIC